VVHLSNVAMASMLNNKVEFNKAQFENSFSQAIEDAGAFSYVPNFYGESMFIIH
jgi:hypothetical protein